jgi:hypothetical protein
MSYLFMLLASALFCGAIACLCMASGLDKLMNVKAGEPSPPLSARFSWPWLVAGVLCIAASVGVFVTLAGPASSTEALETAQEFARTTFREKLGKEPETLDLQDNPAAPYTGTARVGEEVWDVVVTRSGPQGASGTVTMECTLTPRAK